MNDSENNHRWLKLLAEKDAQIEALEKRIEELTSGEMQCSECEGLGELDSDGEIIVCWLCEGKGRIG